MQSAPIYSQLIPFFLSHPSSCKAHLFIAWFYKKYSSLNYCSFLLYFLLTYFKHKDFCVIPFLSYKVYLKEILKSFYLP